jgi:hypothetical protein
MRRGHFRQKRLIPMIASGLDCIINHFPIKGSKGDMPWLTLPHSRVVSQRLTDELPWSYVPVRLRDRG